MKKYLIGAVAVLVIVVFVSFGMKDSGEIKVGALYALSGPVSIYGEISIKGVRDAVKYFKENGGEVNIKLVEEDSVGDPKVGATSAQKMFSVDGVKYSVVGLSNVSAAVAPITDGNDVVAITDATTIGINKDHKNFFQNFIPSFNFAGPYLIEQKAKKVAIIYTNDEFGIKWNEAISGVIKDKIEVKGFPVARDAKDFSTDASKIKQFNPDRILIISYGTSLNQIYKDMANIGIDKNKFIAYLSCTLPGVLTANSLEGSLSYEYPVVQAGGIRDWMEKNNAPKSTFYTSAFENTLVLLLAIDKVGDNPEKVREYLKKNSISGVYGNVEFGDDGVVERDLILTKVQNNACVSL